ncbi:ABC transporter ATP-binding protein [Lachnotalea sp. AF33-28]|uniref:ABC transporter ATP-binding protein n=1 Tax=Lachnotalea sp. AF33-28 TaxID=2292046 RepID=UPI000E515591|nr:ABC transporter ATP-binding protein [Lachnotalea sp. AF33-28]RHP30440.1 ABC transporter ATP-binding protein [Lachnotalea sp. AF33-28]
MSILECQNVTKLYGSKPALKNFSLTLERGRIVGLLGPNGSGKTTLIKLIAGLLTPNQGTVTLSGMPVGVETKSIVSYLPEVTYLNPSMKIKDTVKFFTEFYEDFDQERAYSMLEHLRINPADTMKVLSKGTKEKVQLILVMSRRAQLYVLDEPIGGVDPAARDYILNTIISNYDENATILISTHLIYDIEKVLDEVVFIKYGELMLHSTVDKIRNQMGKSVDGLFREVFRC